MNDLDQSVRSTSKAMMAGASDHADTRQTSHQKRTHNDSHSTTSEQRVQDLQGRGNPVGPLGGAPGRREAFLTGSGVMQLRAAAAASTSSTQNYQQQQDLLNSSSITDNNKNRFQPASQVNIPLPAHPNILPNESVISRSSAL